MYEPHVSALARSLLIILPPWLYPEKREDNWQVAPWDEAIAARSAKSISAYQSEDHFWAGQATLARRYPQKAVVVDVAGVITLGRGHEHRARSSSIPR